jgi:SAM-dependent methyltransferase
MERNYYELYHQVEQQHWWFTARMAILESQVKEVVSKTGKPLKILNIGVATGGTTKMLEKFGQVTSVEFDKECCVFLKIKRDIDAVNASMTALPFDDASFDLVCAFDVIEHIEDDQLAIREAARVLKQGGAYLFTVPAYQFLWSDHDVVNHHFRRYTKKEMAQKIKRNGLLNLVLTHCFCKVDWQDVLLEKEQ